MTTTIIEKLKVATAILAVAVAIFFGYSVAGYISDTFSIADAQFSCGAGCGSNIQIIEPYRGFDNGGGFSFGGGGGGGGTPTPYCAITLTEGLIQSASYPPIKQYIITWSAPYATSFSLNNAVGVVTPATAGTYTFYSSTIPGQYTGTAVTPYGTVTCQTPSLPTPPPTCALTTSTSQCQPDDAVTLSWTTANATALSIAPGIGSVTPVPAGSTSVYPQMTTTYVGTVSGPGGTATCNTTITVTPPPPPPPTPPQCTLDLTKDKITWTSLYAYQVLIVPLTNSPQIPGLVTGAASTVTHGEADAYNSPAVIADMQTNGINLPAVQGNTGFASDQATMNRVCALIDGAGSTASTFGSRNYNSPGNNAVVKYVGGVWTRIGGVTAHMSTSFVCSKPAGISTYPLNGSYNFVPALGVGTHTYKLTATGEGGTVICEDTVVVPPPPPTGECKLEITKTANKTTLAPNEAAEYTISFKNVGDKKCTGSGVKVLDTLDSRLTYQSETHSANITAGYGPDPVYKAADRTVRFNAWDLDPAETGWFKIVVKAGTPTQCSEAVPNKAKITSYEYNNFNTFVDSNTVTLTIAKDCTPPPPEECKLEITKAANRTTAVAGATVEYTLSFKNSGNTKCTGSGVKIYDVVDGNIAYQSETHSSNITAGYGSDPVYKSSDRTIRFNAWDMDPGETGWVKWVGKFGTPDQCSVVVPNKAKITAYEYNNFNTWVESNVVNVTLTRDCTPPPPQECKMEITKTANKTALTANETVEYTITVKNIGGADCTGGGVKIVDVVDSRLTYQSETHSSNITAGYGSDPVYKASDRTIRYNGNTLTPGESGWMKFVAKVGTPTSCSETVPNKAKVTSYEYNNFNTWVESDIVTIALTKDCHVPVPYCTLTGTPTSINAGDPVTLNWNTTNVTSASIDQGVGTVALSGSTVVNPTASKTYTGTFTGPGGTVTCAVPIVVTTPNPVPQCTIAASASQITPGQSVIVTWTSQNVSSGFVTSVGTTTPVSGGSAEVFPADSTTFVGTFKGAYGTATCSVPVTVIRGGGGCQGNCGGGLNQPNVVLLQKPPEAPLAFVTLDQIPYTGFAAGKALTLAFWLAVGLLAAVTTYFVMGKGGVQFVLGGALSAVGVGDYSESEDRAERKARVPNQFQGQDSAAYNGHTNGNTEYATGYANGGRNVDMSYSASVATAAPQYSAPAYVAPTAPVTTPARPAVDGVPELADVIESRAHGAGVLMSPEAVLMALSLSADRGEALRIFGEVLNEAVKTLPREDGWIMLTSEHFAELRGTAATPVTVATKMSTPSVESILASVMTQPTVPKAASNVELPMTNKDDQEVVMALARAILGGNRDLAYSTVRNLEVAGANATTVMTIVAGAFDQLYRARRHGLTTELTVPGMNVSDESLATMVETMTHGMDHSYANAFTGLKLAVAQAFEARG